MNKLFYAKIAVSKIDKSKLFEGKNETYLDLSIWINDIPDKFGNDMSIEQSTKKGENKIYLGNGKHFEKKEDLPEDTPKKKLPF